MAKPKGGRKTTADTENRIRAKKFVEEVSELQFWELFSLR